MDVREIGVFLAELRKEKCWTQEQLGQKLGVTNKTVSRWENGNYMPPVDILLELSKLYDISINEILSGQRLTEAEYHEKAEENIKAALESSFSLQEKIDYFKRKWRKEHRFDDIVAILAILGVYWAGYHFDNGLQFVALLLPIIYHGIRNNRMMTYVELHAFDGTGRQ